MVVLECVSEDGARAFELLEEFLLTPGRAVEGKTTAIVATAGFQRELGDVPLEMGGLVDRGVDQMSAFVRMHRRRPSWTDGTSGFVDVLHDLTVILRQGRYFAVHTEDDLERRMHTWLDSVRQQAPLARIPPELLENSLLQGEAKGLWLKSTDRRRSTRPDTKNLGGSNLHEAYNAHEDPSYAVGAAKAEVETSEDREFLHGTVGTTPPRSSVWFKAAQDLTMFGASTIELFELIEATRTSATTVEAMPGYARRVTDLSAVKGAYELWIADPDQLPPSVGDDDELRAAAAILDERILNVHGQDASADIDLDVGRNGVVEGSLRLRLSMDGAGRCRIEPEPDGGSTDPGLVQQVMPAIDQYKDLIKVYYQSGHTYSEGAVWRVRQRTMPFRGWRWMDFAGWSIAQEKPVPKGAQEIHSGIGTKDDRSLFGWVAKQYQSGWLICDDGAGEVADFVHLSLERELSFIHVKRADRSSAGRAVSAVAYERVVGQAVKNLTYMDGELLQARLRRSPVGRPACWTDGHRVSDRTEFLDALRMRQASHRAHVVIVQPHISRTTYDRVSRGRDQPNPSEDLLRLYLTEGLLNSAHASVSATAELVVVGSLV